MHTVGAVVHVMRLTTFFTMRVRHQPRQADLHAGSPIGDDLLVILFPRPAPGPTH